MNPLFSVFVSFVKYQDMGTGPHIVNQDGWRLPVHILTELEELMVVDTDIREHGTAFLVHPPVVLQLNNHYELESVNAC